MGLALPFLLAYLLYVAGVFTVISMAVNYGQRLGFSDQDLVFALMITNFAGFPATFAFEPIVGLTLLLGIYGSAMFGGAIPAILINTPGTPSSIATTFDGFPLSQKGMAQHALVAAAGERVRAVLEAGVHAPTGGMQPYSIISVSDAETKQALYDMDGCGQKQILNAPVDLLFCLDMHRNARWAELRDAPFTATASFEEWWISFQDVVICAQSMVTAADAMGLGSVYVGTVY